MSDRHGKYEGKWRIQDGEQVGNPTTAKIVQDVLSAIKAGQALMGGPRNHTSPMTYDLMKEFHSWSETEQPKIQLAVKPTNNADLTKIFWHLQGRAFLSLQWMLWSRYHLKSTHSVVH